MKAGTIEELESGRFGVRLPRALDNRRKRMGTYDTYQDAESIVNGTLALAHEQVIALPGGKAFRSFLRDFLDRRELNGIRNIDRDRRVAKAHLETAGFADLPLKAVSGFRSRIGLTAYKESCQNARARSSRPRQFKIQLNLLRVCFQEAMDPWAAWNTIRRATFA